jgi:hypothetical protein
MPQQLSHQTRWRSAQSTARNLGWFSVALGVAELLLTRQVARASGLQGSENLLRLYGVREIANGVGLLAANDRQRAGWMWARVAGDALDIATVATQARTPANAVGTVAALVGVAALDVKTAQVLSEENALRAPAPDYSTRSGFPGGTAEARGVASDVAREAARWLSRPGSEVLPTSRVRAMTRPAAPPAS